MSLARLPLEYCSSVWDHHTLTNINKLEMVQRRAARFVVNDYNRDSSVSNIISKLERPSQQIRRKNNRLAQMFKIVKNLSAISSNDYLTPSKSVTRRNHNFKFIQYSPVSDCFKYSLFPRTVPEWNTLTKNIVSASIASVAWRSNPRPPFSPLAFFAFPND